jgi:hypothetical protein
MEETIVVECSRQSSLEATTGNYATLAEWTCDCGDGIILDIGDKIQVHSGFVSEKGAQAGEIEIKERDRGNIGNITISRDIEYKYPYDFSNKNRPDISSFDLKMAQIYSHECEIGGNEEINDLNINDGETNIVYSPYKTANGEYYATLPRRHVGHNSDIHANKANPYDVFDCSSGPYISGINEEAGIMGNVVFNLDGGKPEYKETFREAWQFCPADYKFVNQNGKHLSGASSYTRLKGMIKNDNSRYTIFRAKKIFRTRAAALLEDQDAYSLLGGQYSVVNDVPGSEEFQDAVDLRDPAILYDWEQVRNLVKIQSKDGFNKPQDVATEITQQMNLRSEAFSKSLVQTIHQIVEDKRFHDRKIIEMYQSPCYKPYNCATSIWDKTHFNAFRQVNNPDEDTTDKAHTYMSMFQHIGIKRPELHIQGRATNASHGFLKPATARDGGNTPRFSQCLNLGLEWNETNLNKLNALFNVEAKYPELFTGVTQTGQESPLVHHEIVPGKHRFLHFNKQDEETTGALNASGYRRHNPKNSLGYDLYGNNQAIPTAPGTDYYHYDNTMASYPVFFDYNEDCKDLGINDVGYCEDGGGGVSDINDLAYGWARKMRIDAGLHASGKDKFYIGIQFTSTGNAVPEFLYNGLSHIALSTIPGNLGRRFGWDYHFSAYGNPCMILYNGFVNANNHDNSVGNYCYDLSENFFAGHNIEDDAGQTATKDMGPFYHELFLGADQPALGYDTNEDRFFFTNLHVSEKVGNPSEAGSVDPEVKANANADVPCYKINKRLLGTSYCPNVAPYTDGLQITATNPYPAQVLMSNNMEPYIPYDAMGGIFIETVAVPEVLWNENLVGVLGFTYEQFNNSEISRQVSIIDRFNATNMKSITTQAQIQVADLISWSKNGFGNSIFSIASPALAIRKGTNPAKTIYEPATIELDGSSESTKITAVNLPTKTARPYYTIRSDIIPQSNFFGGNQNLVKPTAGAVNRPVVGIVNKINGYGDFYSQESSQLVFTNTMKRVITQIKTSIHDPNGSYAKVDDASSVIYKIMKTKQIDLTPLNTLLESKKKSDIMIAETAASMLKDPADAKPNYNYTFSNQ